MTSTDLLLWPASDSRCWCRTSSPSTELNPSSSKPWSDHTSQREHCTLLHQRAGWYHHRLRANRAAQRSHDSSLFWSLRGGTNSRPASGQQSLSVCSRKLKTHMFRLHLDPTEHDSLPPRKKQLNKCLHLNLHIVALYSQH